MPLFIFPINKTLSATSRKLHTISSDLRTIASDSSLQHRDILKCQNELNHIKLRFELAIDDFDEERARLVGMAITRLIYKRDIRQVGLEAIAVRREVERAVRSVEWRFRRAGFEVCMEKEEVIGGKDEGGV